MEIVKMQLRTERFRVTLHLIFRLMPLVSPVFFSHSLSSISDIPYRSCTCCATTESLRKSE
jgi:hypothetical protein